MGVPWLVRKSAILLLRNYYVYKKKLNNALGTSFWFKILNDKCKEFSTHLIRNAGQSSGIEAITFGTRALDELIQECYRFFTMFILIFHHAGLKKNW